MVWRGAVRCDNLYTVDCIVLCCTAWYSIVFDVIQVNVLFCSVLYYSIHFSSALSSVA